MTGVTMLEPQETPFVSAVSKGEAKATYTEWLTDALRKPRKSGTREGQPADSGNNKAGKRARLGTYQHRMMDNFGVTDVQEDVSRKGGNAAGNSEYDMALAKCFLEMKRDMEAICTSSNDHQGGTDEEMLTRGAFDWIDSSGPADVPEDFRALSGAIKASVGSPSALDEDDLNTILQYLQRAHGAKKSYMAIFGDNLIKNADNFVNSEGSTTATRRQVVSNASEHEIDIEVKVFSSSFGRAMFVPTQFNNVDSNGDPDHNAGLVLNMELWELKFLEDLEDHELPNNGSGRNGFIRGKFANCCKNPKGNGKITN